MHLHQILIVSKSNLFLLVFLLLQWGQQLSAQQLKGRIMLNDDTPAQYATVFVPSLGVGAITDTDGYYYIESVPQGKTILEFSHVGYTTHVASIDTLIAGDSIRTIHLLEQAIALNEVFVTPNGEDPATYIFRRIHETAKKNRKQLQYDAKISTSLLAQDLDVVPMIVPKMVLWILKNALKLSPIGGMFDFVIRHEKVQAKGVIDCHCKKGKCSYDGWKMIQTSHNDKDFDKAFRKVSSIDPFEYLYEDFFNAKELPQGYSLKGITEENGKTIDVLCKNRITSVQGNKMQIDTLLLYVVEDDWGILRKEFRSRHGLKRTECRDIGNGIWMPISYIDDPEIIDLNQVIKDAYEESLKEPEEKSSRMEQNIKNRLIDVANGKRQFHPCATMSFSIGYKRD